MPVSDCFDVTRLIGPTESAAIHEAELRDRPGDMGFALRDKLMAGSMVRAVDYIHAQRQRRLMAMRSTRLFAATMRSSHLVPLHVAPRLGVEPEMTAFTVETCLTPFNLSQHPAMVQCTGYSARRLAAVVADRRQTVTTKPPRSPSAAAYERATPWRQRRPLL